MSAMSATATFNKKPYCRACHNAGKPLEEYTNHWTRSTPGPEGVITCPLILNSECGYCHAAGHWTKFCPLLADKNMTVAGGPPPPPVKFSTLTPCVRPAPLSMINRFQIFDDASSEDEEEQEEDDDVDTLVKVPVLDWKKSLGMEPAAEPSKKVLDWKKALGMDTADHVSFPPLNSDTPLKMFVDDGLKKPSWVSVASSQAAPVVAVSTQQINIHDVTEFKKVFGNIKKYTNWADVESSDDEE